VAAFGNISETPEQVNTKNEGLTTYRESGTVPDMDTPNPLAEFAEFLPEPTNWTFDVTTSNNDAVKAGHYAQFTSRVTVSRDAFPDSVDASCTAACIASIIHGGMPTSIQPVY